MTLPATGLHYGVAFDDYRAWPAANISTLKSMAESPAHCKWDMDHPKESEALDLGRAIHVRVFEPARFEKEFFVAPDFDGRTKEGKAIAARVELDAEGRSVLRKAEHVQGMAESLWAHPAARKFLELPGQCEVSALWKDPVTGLLCKARFDKLATLGERRVIVELKSTQRGRAETEAFGREMAKWRYAAQAAYYLWALKEITGETGLHVFLAVESVGPFACNAMTLDDAGLMTGRAQYRAWLDRYAECQASGVWPAYPATPFPVVSLPNWATRAEED